MLKQIFGTQGTPLKRAKAANTLVTICFFVLATDSAKQFHACVVLRSYNLLFSIPPSLFFILARSLANGNLV